MVLLTTSGAASNPSVVPVENVAATCELADVGRRDLIQCGRSASTRNPCPASSNCRRRPAKPRPPARPERPRRAPGRKPRSTGMAAVAERRRARRRAQRNPRTAVRRCRITFPAQLQRYAKFACFGLVPTAELTCPGVIIVRATAVSNLDQHTEPNGCSTRCPGTNNKGEKPCPRVEVRSVDSPRWTRPSSVKLRARAARRVTVAAARAAARAARRLQDGRANANCGVRRPSTPATPAGSPR